MSLDYNKKNITLAKNLRKNATPQEKHLWYDFLSKYKVRFQRQKAIGDFIADFYCHTAKLIIEIDGAQHYTIQGSENDLQRDEWLLQEHGIRTIRFENKDIFINHEGVIEHIREVTREIVSEL
mgnify:CR=1 FL=1